VLVATLAAQAVAPAAAPAALAGVVALGAPCFGVGRCPGLCASLTEARFASGQALLHRLIGERSRRAFGAACSFIAATAAATTAAAAPRVTFDLAGAGLGRPGLRHGSEHVGRRRLVGRRLRRSTLRARRALLPIGWPGRCGFPALGPAPTSRFATTGWPITTLAAFATFATFATFVAAFTAAATFAAIGTFAAFATASVASLAPPVACPACRIGGGWRSG